MFKNNQEDKGRNGEDSSSKAINLVGSATTIKGEVTTETDIRIDGQLEGNIYTHTKIVLGEGGIINGNVYCESADISGQINGNLYSKELLKLQSTSKIHGDIITKRMVVEKGSMFNGQCTMKEQVEFPEEAKTKSKQTTSESPSNQKNIGKVQQGSKS